MPHLTLQISPQGPIVDLLVGVSDAREKALRAANLPVPQPVRIRGLVDTGASSTAIDLEIIKALALSPTCRTEVLTPSTGDKPHECNQYDFSITLVHEKMQMTLTPIAAVASKLSNQGYHALIGRDILANCLFFYNGDAARFALAF